MNLQKRGLKMRRKKVNLTIKGEIDEWMGLGERYELNIFTTDKGELFYNLYGVRKGAVNTSNILAEGYLTTMAYENGVA